MMFVYIVGPFTVRKIPLLLNKLWMFLIVHSFVKWKIVITKFLYCDVVVSKFELQSRYYVHFWTTALEKGMNLFILPYGDNSVTAVLLQGWLWH